jgi:hypothetical protein
MENQSKVSPDRVPKVLRPLRDKPQKNPDPKRQGHIAELAFMHKAAELGFGVIKPSGDIEYYDFILDSGCRLWRVQVKSTHTLRKTRRYYGVEPTHGYARKTYTSDEIDFLVVYIVPPRAWYVIPVCTLTSVPRIYFYPDNPHSSTRFERYRDAWCLMACPRHGPSRPDISVDRRCSSCCGPDVDCPFATPDPGIEFCDS